MTMAAMEHGPHSEELAQQASRRMDATHGLAAILRDARKGALLRMRVEIQCLLAQRCQWLFPLSIAFSKEAFT